MEFLPIFDRCINLDYTCYTTLPDFLEYRHVNTKDI
jgi:hypothetical protein